MRRISLIILLLTSVFIFFSSTLTFAEEKNNNYFVIKGGVYFPQSDDVEDFVDEGINLEVAVGTYTSKHFGCELGVGFFQTKFTEGPKVTAKFVPITFNLLGRYPVGPVDLYGGGGIGAYISKTEVTIGENSDSEVDTFYGFQVLAGGKFYMSNDLFVGMEGKYIWTKTPEQNFFGVPIADLHYDGLIVTLNVGTRF
jgi:opacity protein-like surface antigen